LGRHQACRHLVHNKIQKKKKMAMTRLCCHLLRFKQKQKNERREKNRRKEKKNHRKENKNVEKGRSLPFSIFCIWDEALLLPSSLHIPARLSSPPSSSLVSHVFLKLCATQAQELS
jgi:hypothetical protein